MIICRREDAIVYCIDENFNYEKGADMWAVYTRDPGFAHGLCIEAVQTGIIQLAQRPAKAYNEEGLIPCTFYVTPRARVQMITFLMQKRIFKLSQLNNSVLFNGKSEACGFLSFPASYEFSEEQVREIHERERDFSTYDDGGMDNHVVFESMTPKVTTPVDESLYMSMRRQFNMAFPDVRIDAGVTLWILMSMYWPVSSGRAIVDADFQIIRKKGAERRWTLDPLTYQMNRVFKNQNVTSVCMNTQRGPCPAGILINVPDYEYLQDIVAVQCIWRVRPKSESKVLSPIYQCYRLCNLQIYEPLKKDENHYVLHVADAPSDRYGKLHYRGLKLGNGVTHERYTSRQCAFSMNDDNRDLRIRPISGAMPTFEAADSVLTSFQDDIEKDGGIGEVECFISDMSLRAVATDEQLRCSTHGIHAIGPF